MMHKGALSILSLILILVGLTLIVMAYSETILPEDKQEQHYQTNGNGGQQHTDSGDYYYPEYGDDTGNIPSGPINGTQEEEEEEEEEDGDEAVWPTDPRMPTPRQILGPLDFAVSFEVLGFILVCFGLVLMVLGGK